MPPDPTSLRCLRRSNLSFRAYTFKTSIREWDFVHIMTHDSGHHPLFVYLRYIDWISYVASRGSKLLLDGIKNIYTDKNSCTQAIPWRLALIWLFTSWMVREILNLILSDIENPIESCKSFEKGFFRMWCHGMSSSTDSWVIQCETTLHVFIIYWVWNRYG